MSSDQHGYSQQLSMQGASTSHPCAPSSLLPLRRGSAQLGASQSSGRGCRGPACAVRRDRRCQGRGRIVGKAPERIFMEELETGPGCTTYKCRAPVTLSMDCLAGVLSSFWWGGKTLSHQSVVRGNMTHRSRTQWSHRIFNSVVSNPWYSSPCFPLRPLCSPSRRHLLPCSSFNKAPHLGQPGLPLDFLPKGTTGQ